MAKNRELKTRADGVKQHYNTSSSVTSNADARAAWNPRPAKGTAVAAREPKKLSILDAILAEPGGRRAQGLPSFLREDSPVLDPNSPKYQPAAVKVYEGDFIYDADGYNRHGRDRDLRDREGFDPDGLDAEGFNRDGLDKYGCNREGVNGDGIPRAYVAPLVNVGKTSDEIRRFYEERIPVELAVEL
ncbi:hypothetical protein [Microbacterium sp. MRS-1]|uniref:hypothetical protein n=1 Tax=Microbacterium sp. MRS-1 TaxID=1451261 RepID=UPI00044E95BC|nr:hypothetical protein [Microbacterium sp. MRS-1]EXJ50717.1 hypothetical protein AS96_13020 [Microbacterium sp. MRS-1]